MAQGLEHAHAALDGSVVHRDVSPGNVMITHQGETKLLDFGIAKASFSAIHTEPGIVKGKLAYVAPERLRGGDADPRSDVWALGVVLWELLAGARLFSAPSGPETVRAVLSNAVMPPSLLRRDLPAALDVLVGRSLARDPRARFATARALRLAIEQAMERLGMETSPRALALWMRTHFGEVARAQADALELAMRGLARRAA